MLFAMIFVFPACGNAGGENQPPKPQEGVLTYAVLNPLSKTEERNIQIFNKSHPDAQIKVLDYSDEGGIERLMTQLALGWVPDIMELHRLRDNDEKPTYNPYARYGAEKIGGKSSSEGEYWLPYRQLARKGYLEDLWPYIENDPDLGREGVLEAPLKAAEVDGGLYMLFSEVYIDTLAGAESLVGDRDRWTTEELLEVFSTMSDGSTILRCNVTRWEAYSKLFSSGLDRYIDWETCQCSFDNDEFRSMVEFLGAFPTEFKTTLTRDELLREIVWRRLEGEQMLETVIIDHMLDIPYMDAEFGGKRVAFVGYPTEDGSSGSFFNIYGTTLAMASTCQNKEVAWEFIGDLIRQAYSVGKMKEMHWDLTLMLPINRKSYENGNTADLRITKGRMGSFLYSFPGGPNLKLEMPTTEDLRRFEELVERTKRLRWPDDALSDIVWEALGPYFAGDRTLDETIQLIDNRVGLYLKEQQ